MNCHVVVVVVVLLLQLVAVMPPLLLIRHPLARLRPIVRLPPKRLLGLVLQLVVLGDPGVARAAIAPHALGPVRALRLAELGAPQLVAAPSPRAVEAVVDPLEGTGHDFEIEAALSDGGTTTVHLRVSDRTRRELLSDTYALLGVRGAVATPELLKVERVEGEPPVFVVRVRFRGGLKGEVVVRRASGGTTAPAAIDVH